MSILSKTEQSHINGIIQEVNLYLQRKSTIERILRIMRLSVPKVLLPTKNVNIILNTSNRNPFIMSITPDINELDKIQETLIDILNDPKYRTMDFVRNWCEINTWTLEIDHFILDLHSPLCVEDGEQFVAILFHEIGHVMTENPMALVYNYKLNLAKFTIFEKVALTEYRSSIIRKRLYIPMFLHTLPFQILIRNNRKTMMDEIRADSYIPDEYKGAFVSYIEHHVLNHPSKTYLIVDESEFKSNQKIGINFTKETINMLDTRMDILKRQLQAQYNSPESTNAVKQALKFICDAIGFNVITESTNLNTEYRVKNQCRAICEQCHTKATQVLESTKVTDKDLIILEVQSEDITTVDDKLYMIHRIYDYIESITAEKDKLEKASKKHAPSVTEMKMLDDKLKYLMKLRSKVMDTEVSSSEGRYGLFIKYPKGYEG